MFEIFNLEDTAFPVAPPGSKTAEWYGFQNLNQSIRDSIDRSFENPARLCILNHGRIGAGKTHAAQYFTRLFPSFRNSGLYSNALSIIMEAPTRHSEAFLEFSHRFNDNVQFSRILNASEKIKKTHGKERLYKDVLKITGSEDLATALSNINSSNRLATRTYLAGGGDEIDLNKIGVSRKLTNDHDIVSSIIGIMHILIHGSFIKEGELTRVFLWIDEIENLLLFPKNLQFINALRLLIDKVYEHFTLFLNVTYTEPEELSTIETVLGESLMQIVDGHIFFEGVDKEDLTKYLLELMSNNRVRQAQDTDKYYPFVKDSFEMIIESTVGRTPRYLNKLCSVLLKNIAAEEKYNFKEGNRIDAGMVQKELPAILAYLHDIRT